MPFPGITAAFKVLRVFAPAVLLCAACGTALSALPQRLTVLTSDEQAASSEFVRQLREAQPPGARFDVVRLPTIAGTTALASAAPAPEEVAANAGVRTRGARASAPPSDGLTIAVGPSAARTAIEREGNEPLLLAMLTRLDYEHLKASPGLRRTDRRVGVLLRDPSMADQLALVNAVLPQRRRLGVVTTAESEPLLRELERAATGWSLQVENAPDVQSIAGALRGVLPRSDAILVLPDLIGDDQAATLAVLHAAAGAGLPVFGANDGMVRSGGLAAAVSTPTQMAQQARAMGQKLSAAAAGPVLVEDARPATVRVNATVARGLGLRLPDERELTERVVGAR